jgi:hypothetical protein
VSDYTPTTEEVRRSSMRSWLSDQVIWLGLMIRPKKQRLYFAKVVLAGRKAIREND